MLERSQRCSRRKFLASAAALPLAGGLSGLAAAEAADGPAIFTRPPQPSPDGRKPLAVVCTVYRPLSHAYHIAGRFFHGYVRHGKHHVPAHYVRALHVEQTPDNDLSRDIGKQFHIPVTRRVAEALTDESGKLAVDGVLLIGEHGNYPRNDRGQVLYPRYELFEQIVQVFKKTGRAVPVFNDKHLSYSWDKAKQMAAWSRELGFPLMAGSSLPFTWRRPELELPLEAPLEEAVVAAYGGLEIYGLHILETLQCMAERRKGGESGIRAVTCLSGNDVWRAADAGKFSWALLEAALARSESVNLGDIRRNVAVGMPVKDQPRLPATAFLIEYRDGFRATTLLLNGHVYDFTFAARIKGEAKPASCLFHLPPPPGARYFDCQVAAIERLLETGKPPVPLERTLLTSGALEAAMLSHYQRGQRVETPHLDLSYTAPADSGFMRGSVTGV